MPECQSSVILAEGNGDAGEDCGLVVSIVYIVIAAGGTLLPRVQERVKIRS